MKGRVERSGAERSGAEQVLGLLAYRDDELFRFVRRTLSRARLPHAVGSSPALRACADVIVVESHVTCATHRRIAALSRRHERVVLVAAVRDDEEIELLELGAHAVWRADRDQNLLVARARALFGVRSRGSDTAPARLCGRELMIGRRTFPLGAKRCLLVSMLMSGAGAHVPSSALLEALYRVRTRGERDPTNRLRQLVHQTKAMLDRDGWRIDGDRRRGYVWLGPCEVEARETLVSGA